MKSVALVQASLNVGPATIDAYFLPYSIGCLWAYVQQNELLTQEYKLQEIIVRREDVEQVAERIATCDIVCFSVYVWNAQYSYELAKQIKKRNPNCITIWGGPELPVTKHDIFVKHPFMDYVIKKEGEHTFELLLQNIDHPENVEGLLINNATKIIDTGDASRIDDLETLPSPYLTGVFDKLIQDNPLVEWNAVIETNRGCPYQCTFCDWGSLTYSKIKQIPIQRVFDELEWFGANKIYNIYFADANFGIFLKRDNNIADMLIATEEKYGYPKTHTMTWAKNQKPETLEIVKKLSTKNLTVSAQSMSVDVLDNIKRRNLDQHRMIEIFEKCEQAGVRPETEMILGLPGETLDSWKQGIYHLLECGNHTGIQIYQCQLLENSELNLEQTKEYEIESVDVYDNLQSKVEDSDIEEVIKVVKSTKDMPFDTMLEACMFNTFMQSYHVYGLTSFISRTLYKLYDISYENFYNNLYLHLSKDDWFAGEIKQIKKDYETWFTTGRTLLTPIGGLKRTYMTLGLSAIVRLINDKKLLHVKHLISDFVATYKLDKQLTTQLIDFQFDTIIDPDYLKIYPVHKTYDYDFNGFLISNKNIETPTIYELSYRYGKDISMDDFCARIWFDRKRNFGKTEIKRVEGGLPST
tara:strand:+ start:1845 stop:3758 length:1914 start_codon:yes stop_codon:yes gene_type:complete